MLILNVCMWVYVRMLRSIFELLSSLVIRQPADCQAETVYLVRYYGPSVSPSSASVRTVLPPPHFCPPVLLMITESLLQIPSFGKSDRECVVLQPHGFLRTKMAGWQVEGSGVMITSGYLHDLTWSKDAQAWPFLMVIKTNWKAVLLTWMF